MNKRKVIIRSIAFFLFLILLNLASYYWFFRIDFTADKNFTLSKATIDILKNLKENITITAYFSEDLPTQLIKSKNDFKDLLVEYKNYSKGKVSFSFINPNENEAQEGLAQTEGIKPVMVNVSERDQVQQLRAYMGASLKVNTQKEAIPMIQPGESAEYALTTAIKKLTNKKKPRVAFLQGHGEYPIYVQCRRVVKQEQLGTIVFRFPYYPIIKNFADHPATKGIEAVFFPFLNSINITQKNSAVTITPLAYSSVKSGLVKPPFVIDFNKKWSDSDFNKGPQIAEVALEGTIAGKGNSKMIVFANGKFAVNIKPGQEELNADNVNIISNAIDWLTDDTGLIE